MKASHAPYRVSQKKCTQRTKSQPKLSAMGLNFTNGMTWGRLILLILGKKRPKNQYPETRGPLEGVQAKGDLASALWLQQHSERAFFGTPCTYMHNINLEFLDTCCVA